MTNLRNKEHILAIKADTILTILIMDKDDDSCLRQLSSIHYMEAKDNPTPPLL